jgi:hypothetical protein
MKVAFPVPNTVLFLLWEFAMIELDADRMSCSFSALSGEMDITDDTS